MAHRLTWLDVFTDRALTGNALAVVHDAAGVDDATMRAFARETRLSETTFVQPPARAGADYRNRIWTLTGELPFAGHPSLGTAVAEARARGLADARFVQQTEAGLQPVEVQVEASGRLAHASMLQEPAFFGAEIDAARALGAAGLRELEADPDAGTPQVASTGVAHVVAFVRGDALARLRPDPEALRELLHATGSVVLYLAAVAPDGTTARARSLFLDDHGMVAEDPATGSAAGPLLALLHARAGVTALLVRQGEEMGRPSVLRTEVADDRVRVGGDCVVVAEGEVHL